MNKMHPIKRALTKTGAFQDAGAFALVDGQYGSTGKGLAASVLAQHFARDVDFVTSSAGPNSGHTSYYEGEKVILTQLPTFGVIAEKMGWPVSIYMNAGAIIDPHKIVTEVTEYNMAHNVHVHAQAAVVDWDTVNAEHEILGRIGSTGKGTGAALARKIMRDPNGVFATHRSANNVLYDAGIVLYDGPCCTGRDVAFIEVSQGFSLSLNAAPFYPYCTSRDCTVAQAISDAGMHPSQLRKTMMVLRTYPIRVGGSSGPGYSDQREIEWSEIGVVPEMTTVTGKQRRAFTFSWQQFTDALLANRPDYLFVNFVNYLSPSDAKEFIGKVFRAYQELMGRGPDAVLLGFGPRNEDVVLYE